MEKKNLETPRIRIEHLWPNMPDTLKVGDILTEDYVLKGSQKTPVVIFRGKTLNEVIEASEIGRTIESGSNCIKLLAWWEFRELTELPEYLKRGTDGKIIKVKWGIPHGSLMVSNADYDSWDFMSYVSGEFKAEPSTRAECELYTIQTTNHE